MSLKDTLIHVGSIAAPIIGAAYGQPALGSAIGGALASYGGGQDIAQAQKQASQVQAQAYGQALDWQKQLYGEVSPYLMSSLSSYQNLLQKPPEFQTSPGYLFRLQEGLRAAGIPQGGRQISGPQLKRAIQYGQDYASNEYQRFQDQYTTALARIAGLGQLGAQVSGVGETYGTNIAKLLLGGAQATAGGITGAAEANVAGNIGASRALGQGFLQDYYMNQLRNNQPGGTTVAGGSYPSTPIVPSGSGSDFWGTQTIGNY